MIMSPTTTGKCPHEAFQVIGVDDTTTMPMYPDNLVSTTCTDRLYVLPAAMGDPNCIISTYTNGTHFNTGVSDSEKMLAAKVDRNPIYDHTTVSMMGFIINAFAFPLNPHFLQKVFVAKSDKVLKHSLMILCGGALMVRIDLQKRFENQFMIVIVIHFLILYSLFLHPKQTTTHTGKPAIHVLWACQAIAVRATSVRKRCWWVRVCANC